MPPSVKHFEQMVNACTDELYRYAFGLSQNPATAEDLVQETFLRAWRSRKQLRDFAAMRAWLYQILRNEHARLYQRLRPGIQNPAHLPEIPVRGYDTSASAFALRQNLHRLAVEYREPLLLQVLGGYSTEEIADMMKISRGAVMSRLHRARRQLRTHLAPVALKGGAA